jgi:hypothetical protein
MLLKWGRQPRQVEATLRMHAAAEAAQSVDRAVCIFIACHWHHSLQLLYRSCYDDVVCVEHSMMRHT